MNPGIDAFIKLHRDGSISGVNGFISAPEIQGTIASDKITKAECIAIMTQESYPFDADTKFIVRDNNKKATVEYFANGDTDQSGTSYSFMTINTELAV